ncbi:hypothetical protein N8T08_010518 [Aspergillus melleus]|uniref:Uncharacterized protein n=1 Tax=Aspergillus melleus TaxID=138277 RepID=A0ACC3ARR4_9EURO|nr:uncharacterized protein LDX57_001978 [Aspergillus melleus]KAH8424220.1 hypothetical protein LDX57_001978 [Aspergillus melleus]KAK1140315.1 hypothetical protein N8T08_010518 [Aspergillus melleus]
MIAGLAHINLLVPPGTLEEANLFYTGTLGLTAVPVPPLQKETTAWFNISDGGQQVHIGFGENEPDSPRHPCFRVGSVEELHVLKQRIYDHHVRGGKAAPMSADKPGEAISGEMGVEYPTRFFARDYAGNRLEFSL